MIFVSRDLEGLAAAADEFFSEGLELPIALRVIRETEPEGRDEAEEKLLPRRQAADGYFVWLHYLVWLEGLLEYADLNLTIADIEGLRILRAARSRFLREHPPCRHCGQPEGKDMLRCRHCGGELK